MINKYKIMIVDVDVDVDGKGNGNDEEEVAGTLKKHLEIEGYKVEISRSSIDALDKIKNDKYHIVLATIEMPVMDGLELLREIKKYDPMTQIIMMTADSTMGKILSSLEYGANDYIYKPLKNVESVMGLIEYSVQKLERWRAAIIQIVK